MSEITPGKCRYCGCTEDNPCSVPPYNEGDVCGWLSGTRRTVCNAPGCARRWGEECKAAKLAARPPRRSSADINKLICGRGRSRKKKGRTA